MALMDRLKHAWNIFKNKDPTQVNWNIGPSYGYRPDRMRYTRGNERSIVTAVYNRIAMDVAAVNLKHIRLDENDRYKETIDSGLNNCLSVEANLDQTGRAFIQDLVASMLDEGCVAAVPTDADDEPEDSGNFKVYTLRTGKILEWYPRHVKVEVYNEQEGQRQQIIIPKSTVPLI